LWHTIYNYCAFAPISLISFSIYLFIYLSPTTGFVNGVRGFHSQAEDASYNGIGDVISECKSGIMETASGMFKAKNARAFGYLMIIWLFTLVNVFHNVPLFFKLLFVSRDWKNGHVHKIRQSYLTYFLFTLRSIRQTWSKREAWRQL